MKLIRYSFLIVLAAVLIAISLARPRWFTGNSFLSGAMSIDLLSLLVVILTITFASVANIHLTLNRLLSGAAAQARTRADEVRGEINGNAWVLFGAFVTAALALVLKGALPDHSSWQASTYAMCIMVVTLNVLVLHDIYQAMFALTALDIPQATEATAHGTEEDYAD